MKIKNKIRHSLLTAAILLTVSGGSAYAMPTGGNVTMGNVTNVANPAEIMTANANSIINWDSFSVGVGEKVTFDTQKFMVLNRVRGGQESQILGMLSDQGQGKLLLINPAGIVLGENSVINANELVLSTMSLSDTQFKAIANGNVGVFEGGVGNNEKIEIKSGANLTLNEALRLYGGKITIADGVEIISKESGNANVDIAAGIREITDLKETSRLTYDEGTNVEIGDANIGTMSNPISNITIKAAKTTLDKTDVVVNGNNSSQHNILIGSTVTNINSSKLLNRRGDIFIANISSGSWSYDNDGSIKTFEAKADPDYEVAIKNSSINTEKAKDITIIGGNVTLDHSQLNSGKDIFVGAVKTYDSKEGVRTATTYENSVINADKDTVVHALGHAEAYGANLNIQAQRFDNVIDSTNPIVKYIGKDGVSLWELAPYIDTERDMNLDYYYNNLNGKTLGELIMMALENRKNGIVDEKLDATIEYLQKKLKGDKESEKEDEKGKNDPRLKKYSEFRDKINTEKEKANLLERDKRIVEVGLNLDKIDAETKNKLYNKICEDKQKLLNLREAIEDECGNILAFAGKFDNLPGKVAKITSEVKELKDAIENKDNLSYLEQDEEICKHITNLLTEGTPIGPILNTLYGVTFESAALSEDLGNNASGDKIIADMFGILYKASAGAKDTMDSFSENLTQYTPAGIKWTLGNAILKGGEEYFNSRDKYSKDGYLSTTDKINSNMEGTTAIVKEILHDISGGADEVIWGSDYDKKFVENAENISGLVGLGIDLINVYVPGLIMIV